jgi:hypothetical protein
LIRTDPEKDTMESSIATSLFKEMANAIHALYRAAPPIPFKHGNEFYSALRAADKAKVLLEGDLEALIEMEREDTRYWRQRYIMAARHEPSSPSFSMGSAASDDHIGISIAPAETRNIIIGSPDTPLSAGLRPAPLCATPLSHGGDEEEGALSPLNLGSAPAAPRRSSPLNPEEDDDDDVFSPIELAASAASAASSVSMPPPTRPRVTLFGITATPNMGPILPSPLRSIDALYDAI